MKELNGMPDEKKYLQNFFEKILLDSPVIFDVGSNIGGFTEDVFTLCPDADVFGFEPIKELQPKLKEKFKKNNFALFEFGLSNETGLKEFYVPRATECSSIYVRNNFPGDKRNIWVDTLDNVSSIVDHIDYLKIDAEGHEYDILLGAMETIKQKKISNIQFEYGDCYELANVSLNQVIELLSPYYNIFHPDFGYVGKHFNLLDGVVRNFLAEAK